MWPIVLTTAFVVQSSLLLIIVHCEHNPPQSFNSGIKKLPDIYWNTSNPIFRIDNTDHIIDVNQGRSPSRTHMEYDQVNIVCPHYDNKTTPNIADTETFVIYHVNREEYDMCRIMTAHPKVIAFCNKPYSRRALTFTLSFRSFSPLPGALEFNAGKDYYFISTSSKNDLHLRANGMCRTHNMKLVFKVADGMSKPAVPVMQQQDNLATSKLSPSFNEATSVEEASEVNKHETKEERRRRRKKERERQRNKQLLQEFEAGTQRPQLGNDLAFMNDNPKFRQKEPSQVEKVNNLMKQEASIFAGGAMATHCSAPIILIAGMAILTSI